MLTSRRSILASSHPLRVIRVELPHLHGCFSIAPLRLCWWGPSRVKSNRISPHGSSSKEGEWSSRCRNTTCGLTRFDCADLSSRKSKMARATA